MHVETLAPSIEDIDQSREGLQEPDVDALEAERKRVEEERKLWEEMREREEKEHEQEALGGKEAEERLKEEHEQRQREKVQEITNAMEDIVKGDTKNLEAKTKERFGGKPEEIGRRGFEVKASSDGSIEMTDLMTGEKVKLEADMRDYFIDQMLPSLKNCESVITFDPDSKIAVASIVTEIYTNELGEKVLRYDSVSYGSVEGIRAPSSDYENEIYADLIEESPVYGFEEAAQKPSIVITEIPHNPSFFAELFAAQEKPAIAEAQTSTVESVLQDSLEISSVPEPAPLKAVNESIDNHVSPQVDRMVEVRRNNEPLNTVEASAFEHSLDSSPVPEMREVAGLEIAEQVEEFDVVDNQAEFAGADVFEKTNTKLEVSPVVSEAGEQKPIAQSEQLPEVSEDALELTPNAVVDISLEDKHIPPAESKTPDVVKESFQRFGEPEVSQPFSMPEVFNRSQEAAKVVEVAEKAQAPVDILSNEMPSFRESIERRADLPKPSEVLQSAENQSPDTRGVSFVEIQALRSEIEEYGKLLAKVEIQSVVAPDLAQEIAVNEKVRSFIELLPIEHVEKIQEISEQQLEKNESQVVVMIDTERVRERSALVVETNPVSREISAQLFNVQDLPIRFSKVETVKQVVESEIAISSQAVREKEVSANEPIADSGNIEPNEITDTSFKAVNSRSDKPLEVLSVETLSEKAERKRFSESISMSREQQEKNDTRPRARKAEVVTDVAVDEQETDKPLLKIETFRTNPRFSGMVNTVGKKLASRNAKADKQVAAAL